MRRGVSGRGLNAGDCSIQRRKIHVMSSALIEPPITFAATTSIATVWVKGAQDGFFSGPQNCGGGHWLKGAVFSLQPVDLNVAIRRIRFYEKTLPLRGRYIC